MQSKVLFLSGLLIAATAQQIVQQSDPPVVTLSTTKSGVLPTLPTETPFVGVGTIQGAIFKKGPPNPSYEGLEGPASVQSNLPTATYVATLPSVMYNPATGATISGSISGMTNSDGTGVMFKINFQGFPSVAQYGPFVYHIHDAPVPSNGDCTATMAHLDPTNRGEYYPCVASNPASCQAGDLAGKHGRINGTSLSTSYSDLYLSTDPSSPYFFGSKSIVLHTSNTTRLTCANFVMSNGSTSTGTTPLSTGGIIPPSTGSASHSGLDISAAVMGLLATGLITALL